MFSLFRSDKDKEIKRLKKELSRYQRTTNAYLAALLAVELVVKGVNVPNGTTKRVQKILERSWNEIHAAINEPIV